MAHMRHDITINNAVTLFIVFSVSLGVQWKGGQPLFLLAHLFWADCSKLHIPICLLNIWPEVFDFFPGLFEVRAQEYLDSLPGSEQRGVNKFLKGLGENIKLHC